MLIRIPDIRPKEYSGIFVSLLPQLTCSLILRTYENRKNYVRT